MICDERCLNLGAFATCRDLWVVAQRYHCIAYVVMMWVFCICATASLTQSASRHLSVAQLKHSLPAQKAPNLIQTCRHCVPHVDIVDLYAPCASEHTQQISATIQLVTCFNGAFSAPFTATGASKSDIHAICSASGRHHDSAEQQTRR